jgi:oligoendopeptidase F
MFGVMNAPARPLPNWDMSPYFTAHGAPDYLDFQERLQADLSELGVRAGALSPAAADHRSTWVVFLTELEQAEVRLRHLESYLGCLGSADARDEAVKRDLALTSALEAELQKSVMLTRARLGETSDADFEELLSEPALVPVGYWLRRARHQAQYSMPADHETLVADLAITGISAWGRLYDQISGTLTFELGLPGGEVERRPVSTVQSLLGDPDPSLRRAALEGANRAWEGQAEALAACLNAISGTRLVLYRRRKISHFLQPALFEAGITRRTLDAMLSAVRDRQELGRRYLRRKATLLGRERLGFQDLEAPLPAVAAGPIGWESAQERVLEAFRGFYPALYELAHAALTARWVDYEPRDGKRPGGFCSSSPLIDQSRIFMTFLGARGDVTTLAHELGHAFHSWLMHGTRRWSRDYPMTLAETASTFAEQAVSDVLLNAPEATAADQLGILDLRLSDAATYLLNIPMRFDFECSLYEERAQGELTVSQLKDLMTRAQRANYGDALDRDQLNPWFWASKLHFYVTDLSFYNFPYVFGFLLSLGLLARAKLDKGAFFPRYEALLARSGSETVETIARETLDADLGAPEFWHACIDRIEQDLQRFEALLEARAPTA